MYQERKYDLVIVQICGISSQITSRSMHKVRPGLKEKPEDRVTRSRMNFR